MECSADSARSSISSSQDDRLGDMLRQVVTETIAAPLAELRRFVDRRLAELSVEIHATSQLLGFTEAALSQQLGRMHEQIGQIVAPAGEAARNTGFELETVVQTTEAAANQIMEAAEAIGDWVREAALDKATLNGLTAKIDAIFEACAFQDLTGQRVRRTIDHLHQLETALAELVPAHEDAPMQQARLPDLGQSDIDLLLERGGQG